RAIHEARSTRKGNIKTRSRSQDQPASINIIAMRLVNESGFRFLLGVVYELVALGVRGAPERDRSETQARHPFHPPDKPAHRLTCPCSGRRLETRARENPPESLSHTGHAAQGEHCDEVATSQMTHCGAERMRRSVNPASFRHPRVRNALSRQTRS